MVKLTDEHKAKLGNREWRISHLYKIVDKDGKVVDHTKEKSSPSVERLDSSNRKGSSSKNSEKLSSAGGLANGKRVVRKKAGKKGADRN